MIEREGEGAETHAEWTMMAWYAMIVHQSESTTTSLLSVVMEQLELGAAQDANDQLDKVENGCWYCCFRFFWSVGGFVDYKNSH